MTTDRNERKPLDVAADLFVFAPVGIAIELGKQLPQLARQGRSHLEGPLAAAKFMGNMAAMQGRREFGEKFRQATEPFFTGASTTSTPGTPSTAAETTVPTPKSDLPIAGYETLSASQIVSHLGALNDDELRDVAEYERSTRGRKTILGRIETLLDASS